MYYKTSGSDVKFDFQKIRQDYYDMLWHLNNLFVMKIIRIKYYIIYIVTIHFYIENLNFVSFHIRVLFT